jgi:uncharacterized MAPEG superfamily protein
VHPEMFWLGMSILLCLVIWIPYTALYGGLVGFKTGSIAPPPHDKLPPWALRLHRSHINLLESLVPLVALILMLKTMGKVEDTTATAAAIFFFARVAHAITYALGVPWVRPVFFTIGWLVNCYLLWKVLV